MLIGGSERAFAIEPANPNVMHAWVLPILVDKQMSFGKPILTHAYLPEIYLSTKPSFYVSSYNLY